MRRDFSAAAFQDLEEQLRQIQGEQTSFIADFLGDLLLRIKYYLNKHSVPDDLDGIRAYHRDMLDMENASLDQISEIFENISSIDADFGLSSVGFYGAFEALGLLRMRAADLSTVCIRASSAVKNGNGLESCITPYAIAVATDSRKYYGEEPELKEVPFTSKNFHQLSDSVKDRYVQGYEALHPEQAMLLDRVLSDPDLSARERRDIRFMIYSAPEPFRTLYLEHLSRYIVDVDAGIDGAYYSGYDLKIHIRDIAAYFGDDSCGPYTTFFHESGHAIDDFENESGFMYTSHYVYQGERLHDLVAADARNYVDSYMRGDSTLKYLTDAQRYEILRSLNLTDDADFNYDTGTPLDDPALEAARQAVIRHMQADLAGNDNSCPSDVYGGVTNNAIRGNWGHFSDSYWYRGGNATGAQEHELWAEFFAAKMTHNEEALASIRRHFPRAFDAMEAMAEEMTAN